MALSLPLSSSSLLARRSRTHTQHHNNTTRYYSRARTLPLFQSPQLRRTSTDQPTHERTKEKNDERASGGGFAETIAPAPAPLCAPSAATMTTEDELPASASGLEFRLHPVSQGPSMLCADADVAAAEARARAHPRRRARLLTRNPPNNKPTTKTNSSSSSTSATTTRARAPTRPRPRAPLRAKKTRRLPLPQQRGRRAPRRPRASRPPSCSGACSARRPGAWSRWSTRSRCFTRLVVPGRGRGRRGWLMVVVAALAGAAAAALPAALLEATSRSTAPT